MNLCLVVCAFALVALNFASAADVSGGWVLGVAGVSSCTIVCQNIAKNCFFPSMQALDTKTEFNYVNTRLGSAFTCSQYTATGLKYNPSANPSLGNCNYNGTLSACGSPSTTMPSGVRRICCCQDSGCLLTNPVGSPQCSLCHRPPTDLCICAYHTFFSRPSTVKSHNGRRTDRAQPHAAPVLPLARALS
jgi:hypothetical protein